MTDVTIEGTVLVVTPIQSGQSRPMVQITLGDPFKGPVTFPLEMDKEIARLWLEAHGLKIDTMSEAQKKYLGSWQ